MLSLIVSWNVAAPPSNFLKEARTELLSSIQNSKPKLKRAVSDDKSQPVEAGKVLHKHLAPRVFTREVRDLMHEIQEFDKKDKKSKLKKTKTYDRSKPYIPKDIEIFFYGGKDVENNKSLAPPPKSREIPNKTSPSPPPTHLELKDKYELPTWTNPFKR